jgi:hypothetical protein
VSDDLLDHHRILDAGNDPYRTTALPSSLDQQDFLKIPRSKKRDIRRNTYLVFIHKHRFHRRDAKYTEKFFNENK